MCQNPRCASSPVSVCVASWIELSCTEVSCTEVSTIEGRLSPRVISPMAKLARSVLGDKAVCVEKSGCGAQQGRTDR
jgi:hypothetical protein